MLKITNFILFLFLVIFIPIGCVTTYKASDVLEDTIIAWNSVKNDVTEECVNFVKEYRLVFLTEITDCGKVSKGNRIAGCTNHEEKEIEMTGDLDSAGAVTLAHEYIHTIGRCVGDQDHYHVDTELWFCPDSVEWIIAQKYGVELVWHRYTPDCPYYI